MTTNYNFRRLRALSHLVFAELRHWFPVVVFVLFVTMAHQPADAAPPPTVVSAHIVSRVGGEARATDRPVRARADRGVTLHAVLRVRTGRRVVTYSDAGPLTLGGRTYAPRPMAEAPSSLFLWYRVEPTAETMSNTASGRFRFESINYAETPILRDLFRSSIAADVRPTLIPDRGDGFGTMRYRLVAVTPTGVVSTPGKDSRRGRGSGGLSDGVHRVSLRKDDTYLGFLTELYGQPYIWASGGRSDASHQSERLEGADCADFVVYGQRRMGRQVPYTWTGGLPEHTRSLTPRVEPDPKGVYRDKDGEPARFTRPGDLILFQRHVGVLVEDRGTPGILDHEDIMVHTLFASPHPEPIGDTSYASGWAQLLRWK